MKFNFEKNIIHKLIKKKVVGEYDKDSMERRAIIYTVFGQDHVTKQFVDTCPRFLQNGYEEEYLLFADKI